MIHKVGLLPTGNHQQVPFAYKMYMRDDATGWAQSTAFKKAFSMDVDVYFLGTWDCVASVGLIPRSLPFVKSNTHVKYYRHAMSLDEHRARFKVSTWRRPEEHEEKLGVQSGDMPKSKKRPEHHPNKVDKQRDLRRRMERTYSMLDKPTNVLEVWFAGAHCDVGGGNVLNGTRNALARIPLRWMLRECFKTNTGIMFHREMFHSVGMEADNLYPVVRPRPPPVCQFSTPRKLEMPGLGPQAGSLILPDDHDFLDEDEEDLRDALCPLFDQLERAKGWWILEILPNKQRWAEDDLTLTRFLL